uniref:Variant surface glycoprotein 1125.2919 n=1 Tax=Trypanosoma brucei TaxID=5691 RepID=A0A1J0R945_9TRYP|nr:variant surface glycoprotein 1125.2919 [Trypanosoma brucei]
MTLSNPEWQQIFNGNNGKVDLAKAIPTALKHDQVWQKHCEHWKKVAKAVETNRHKNFEEESGIKAYTGEKKNQLRTELAPYLAKASKHKRPFTGSKARKTENRCTNSFNDNTRSCFRRSQDKGYSQLHSLKDFFKHGNLAPGRQLHGKRLYGQGDQVAATFLCVCAMTSDELAAACVNRQSALGNWNGQDDEAEAKLKEILQHCPTTTDVHDVETTIVSTINDLKAELYFGNTDGHLGAYMQNSCNGSNSVGIWVTYTSLTKTDSSAFDKTAWIEKLSSLTGALKSNR